MRWGFEPDAFWKQTPASFAAAVQGRVEAAEEAIEESYFNAWATERFAREKKLKAFQHYAADLKPKRPKTPKELLTMFKGFGDKVRIKRAASAPSKS
ncbi:hypothetical protein [Sphingomonas sanxanigenens]|uniref:Phage tail assembly chaperone n=1 Tax=Sphingomonas sanxanigenens DSM 19645 = NX02 TaxID=1123269 RepID=W0AG83_9SPHN|nr:hypothetical protein [Sphingomonas sanxanigenens]AHE55537.1 hypothetical protein NX02_19385 [Sphingomonas sanxanigenens DSM 19645 = NX02]